MKILFLGDSITDMFRNREVDEAIDSYGNSYVFIVKSKLSEVNPNKYQIINKGNGGDRSVDLYARIKKDVWNYKPDVLSILVGINDIWHDVSHDNGVDIVRYERIYRMIIEDTLKELPNVKIILCEPFILNSAFRKDDYYKLVEAYEYAKIVRKLSSEYNLEFVELQKPFIEASSKYGIETYLYDGVHPNVAGATLIANEWLKTFKKIDK